ncbi:MAG UNVERIFIED_CONTAM: sigma-70 family RNA polymerase sigma factor [Planctomycetaceae bacterium]
MSRSSPATRLVCVAWCRCLLVPAADVDDVLQEINTVLWEKAADFKAGTDFWAWASQIARFKVFNHLRRHGRERLVFDELLLNEIADLAQQKLADVDRRREALEDCLGRLQAPQRQLIELRYTSGHAIAKIAEVIGRPEASVRQTLFRIRQALQACIESKLQSGGTT